MKVEETVIKFCIYFPGLFHRAISQSGTSICHWSLTKNPNEAAKKLGQKLNCPIGSTDALMKCLQSVDAMKIAETQFDIQVSSHILQGLHNIQNVG